MKVIAHFNAVTTIASPWDEVRPLKGVGFLATQQVIRERYQFQVAGQSAISQQIGMVTPSFGNGQFRIGETIAPINQFEFQPQAVIISCSTTEQTNKFFDDVFPFLQKSLEYRIPPKERARQCVTAIIVDFEVPVAPLFDKWTTVQNIVSQAIGRDIAPFSIRFGPLSPENVIAFEHNYVFERRAVTPAGEHWYFSQAPLDTNAHLELLSEINAAIST
jgi:hypothetical protein